MEFCKELLKLKLLTDYYFNDFSNSYKLLFMVQELGINSPKELCKILNMAKSNLAVLAGKLRLVKYLEQHKSEDNLKEIFYKVTPLGNAKLSQKLAEISKNDLKKADIVNIIKSALQKMDK